jgi:hypothetical protein
MTRWRPVIPVKQADDVAQAVSLPAHLRGEIIRLTFRLAQVYAYLILVEKNTRHFIFNI